MENGAKKVGLRMAAGVLIAITIIFAVFASGITLPRMEKKTGILTVLLTDAPVDLESLYLTISGLEVHRVADEDAGEGVWETLVGEGDDPIPRFDLLTLQDGNTLKLASESISAGTYNKIRLYISDDPEEVPQAIYEDEENYPDNPYKLNVPSNKIDVITNFTLEEGEAETVLLDMQPDYVAISNSGNLRPIVKVVSE
jgi:hypothetical protein